MKFSGRAKPTLFRDRRNAHKKCLLGCGIPVITWVRTRARKILFIAPFSWDLGDRAVINNSPGSGTPTQVGELWSRVTWSSRFLEIKTNFFYRIVPGSTVVRGSVYSSVPGKPSATRLKSKHAGSFLGTTIATVSEPVFPPMAVTTLDGLALLLFEREESVRLDFLVSTQF